MEVKRIYVAWISLLFICVLSYTVWDSHDRIYYQPKTSSVNTAGPRVSSNITASSDAQDINILSLSGSARASDQNPSLTTHKENRKPLCTYRVLRNYYKEHHFWPSEGRWNITTVPARYVLDLCELHYPEYPASLLDKCLLTSNVTSIVTFGDSNGARRKNALLGSISRIGKGTKCQGVAAEKVVSSGFMPDKGYYAAGNQPWAKFVHVQERNCRTCLGERKTCHVKSKQSARDISSEHMSWIFVTDKIITVSGNESNVTWNAATTQEFYFKYLLKGRYPDMLILFLPFNHAMHDSLDVYYQQLRSLKSLVHKYIPPKTKVFFMPVLSEFSKRYKTKYAPINGLERNDRLELLNQELFRIMESDFLDEESGYYGFVDIFSISKPRIDWSLDGIHYKGQWYNFEMSMFWDIFCNSVLHDEM